MLREIEENITLGKVKETYEFFVELQCLAITSTSRAVLLLYYHLYLIQTHPQ